MAVIPDLSPHGSLDAPSGLGTVLEQRRPRSVPAGTPVYTKREIIGLQQLETTFRDMYTRALPELEGGASIVVGVTSAVRGEGRTTTALALALTMARDLDVHVLLVELDMECPSLAREMQLPESPGLAEVLTDDVWIGSAVRHLEAGGIDLLPAGGQPDAASRLLRSSAMKGLLAAMRESYQVVVLDLPPALSSSDIVPLSGLADTLLLVVRAGVTPARLALLATERFAEGKVRGVIVSGQRSKIPNWLRRLF